MDRKTRDLAQEKLVSFREGQSGSGYGRSSPLEAHFGPGRKPVATYRVEVSFPAAKKHIVKQKVKPGQRLPIKETDDSGTAIRQRYCGWRGRAAAARAQAIRKLGVAAARRPPRTPFCQLPNQPSTV